MKKQQKIYIGTSGWQYKHWNSNFYLGIKQPKQFEFYTAQLNTVELNNSFYRQPSAQNFENWRKAAPAGFVFTVKANRFFTHLKKLNVTADDLKPFINNTMQLKDKLGVILFQLPPKWNINIPRLANFLALLPTNIKYVFEFRNQTWYHPQTYLLLQQYNCAFCIYELAGHLSPIEITADFVYVRLHGPGDKYQGSYTDETLQTWANYCKEWQQSGKTVFIYFDNDQEGYAAYNAQTLQQLIDAS